ncbi:unnamed protein product [Aureobasidium pullulans]|nr:unnamed protein product [Aureobasidium pullulans]
MPWIRKGPWDPEEDKLLLQIVAKHGLSNWGRVSRLVQTRTPKQCTERYTQHLKGGLDHSALTEHESPSISEIEVQAKSRTGGTTSVPSDNDDLEPGDPDLVIGWANPQL